MKMRFFWHLFFRSFIGYPGICGMDLEIVERHWIKFLVAPYTLTMVYLEKLFTEQIKNAWNGKCVNWSIILITCETIFVSSLNMKAYVSYSHSLIYFHLSLKCKISAIWLVETACIFLIFLIATVQISMDCEMQES